MGVIDDTTYLLTQVICALSGVYMIFSCKREVSFLIDLIIKHMLDHSMLASVFTYLICTIFDTVKTDSFFLH